MKNTDVIAEEDQALVKQRTYLSKQGVEVQVENGSKSRELYEMNTADIIGLLERLPSELSQLAARYSPDSILWRYGAAITWPAQDLNSSASFHYCVHSLDLV